MVPTVDIAPALFHQLVDVKRSMQQLQLSPNKTEEVITAYILNQWWAEQGLPYSIAIATPPTGYDGLLKVNGQVPEGQTMSVEFKSAQKKGDGNCGFQFNPDPAKFVFTDHACIACTEFEQGWPVRIFVALAPFGERRCMQALQQVLQSEGVRAKLTAQGWHMDDTSAQALARRMAQDARINGELIARKNIRLQ